MDCARDVTKQSLLRARKGGLQKIAKLQSRDRVNRDTESYLLPNLGKWNLDFFQETWMCNIRIRLEIEIIGLGFNRLEERKLYQV